MRGLIFVLCLGMGGSALADTLPVAISDDDYRPINMDEAKLGHLLFYDPILSGNKEVACATCHHPKHGTGDGLSLGLGDGGMGLGPERVQDPNNPPEQRIPRNAPALFNLGAHEFTVLFHDGRIAVDETKPNGLRTPLDGDMVTGFSTLLSAQTMFPVLSPDEMAGHYSENDVSKAVRQGLITGTGGAWDIISRRVANIPEYAQSFKAVYPHIQTPDQITFADISNAIAVFMEFEWRSDTAPFDAFLRGQGTLNDLEIKGMKAFYGDAGCSECHAGAFQTDHGFHAMAAPQIGPGKAARFESHAQDKGRFRVTGDTSDLYAFRTPSLRNVALTGPYGHAGAHGSLQEFVADHIEGAQSLNSYRPEDVVLPDLNVDDFKVLNDTKEMGDIAAAAILPKRVISVQEQEALIAFLGSLTDLEAQKGRLGVPQTVPSGLKVPN